MIADTVILEFTRDIVLHNASLGHDLSSGKLVCAEVFRAERVQWARVHSGMFNLLVPGCAIDPFAPPEELAEEVPDTPADPVPGPAYRPPSRVGKPRPALVSPGSAGAVLTLLGTCGAGCLEHPGGHLRALRAQAPSPRPVQVTGPDRGAERAATGAQAQGARG